MGIDIQMDVRERTVCFSDYVMCCADLQYRELLSVDIGMKEDLRTKQLLEWIGLRESAYLINGRFNLG
jgi:hypothetical protein